VIETALFVGSIVAILAVTGFVVYAKLSTMARGEWVHEDDFCTCGHGFYDHIHRESESPCTMLMCSCREFRFQRGERP
jgi:hypothetical protein